VLVAKLFPHLENTLSFLVIIPTWLKQWTLSEKGERMVVNQRRKCSQRMVGCKKKQTKKKVCNAAVKLSIYLDVTVISPDKFGYFFKFKDMVST
jgi:hypothetical protein